MARMHSAFVCADACAQIAKQLGVNDCIQTADENLKLNKTVLADAMEAIIGAVFIDSNYDKIKKIVLSLWKDIVANYNEWDQEPKTHLQELCQAQSGATPVYKLLSISGPDHRPEFLIELQALGKTIQSKGGSRKEAETTAARELLKTFCHRAKR